MALIVADEIYSETLLVEKSEYSLSFRLFKHLLSEAFLEAVLV